MGKLLCKLFGHPLPAQGWWGDGLYSRVVRGARDNIGTTHYSLRRVCERCGAEHQVGRFHGNSIYHDHLKEEIAAQRSFGPVMDNHMQFLRHFAGSYTNTTTPVALSPEMVKTLCEGIDHALTVVDTVWETASGRTLSDEEKYGWSKLGWFERYKQKAVDA